MNQTLKLLNTDNIEYYTPNWVWDCLKPYIPPNKQIWECFRNEDIKSTQSAEYLRELGFDVINPLCDFFKNDYGDIVISNPPYNIKKEVLFRLIEINKPFMLILPNIILNTLYFIELAKQHDELQIIILPKRVDFIKPSNTKSKSTFHTLVICYKCHLKDRITFI